MFVTRKTVLEKLSAYLSHKLTLAELVDWAEQIMQEGDFDKKDYDTLRDIITRLGLADVRAFGLTWEDCEQFIHQLGYTLRVDIVEQE